MIQTLYITRHGFRSSWNTGDRANRNDPLSDLGLTQAQELATYLASLDEDKRPTAIFSSPYYRCLQTSQQIALALGLPIYVDHWLSEWYSDLTASKGIKQPELPNASILRENFSEIDADAWSSLWYPPNTGENIDQITERMAKFLGQFIPQVEFREKQDHERVLLVTHAAPLIALVRNLLHETTDARIKPGCCSITEFARNVDVSPKAWLPTRIGDSAHVSGDTREWGFEDYY